MEQTEIKKLKDYFRRRKDVLMAFVFGSRAKARSSKISDWDIACYLKPLSKTIEYENEMGIYPQEDKIWGELIELLDTDNVDLLILNRVPATIAASAIKGLPLVVKDRRLYLEFMLRVTQAAEDFQRTADEYAKIYWRSTSLSQEDRDILQKRLIFLDTELKDAQRFQNLTQSEYEKDSAKRRETERWVENLMNAIIDIAKTLLASEKRAMPSTYRAIVRSIGLLPEFSQDLAEQLSDWTGLRNILAHEYLDIRWKKIENFIQQSPPYFSKFSAAVKKKLGESSLV